MKVALAPIALRSYLTKPDFGAYINTYRNDITTMLRNVKKCGYDGIEMGTPEGFTKEEYKDCLETAGLQAASGNALTYPLLAGNDFKTQIEDCRYLGAKNIMVSHLPALALGNPEELKKFIADLNRVGRILMEEGGIHLSYHNHAVDFSKVNGAPLLEQIIQGTDERYVFFEPDTHWLQAGGAHVISWLKKLKGRIYIVHFKDYAIDPYSDYTFLECTHKLFAEIGEGNLNWPGILDECHRQGIEWCAVEQDVVQRPAYEALALSAKNLRAFGV